ncbi:MAG: hypothetical protein ACK5LK_08665, partial [Chthoniobacterales bacterium]
DSRTIITKTKPLYHEQTIFSSGSKSDIWYTGDVFLTVNDGADPLINFKNEKNKGRITDYSKTDFPAFSWISKKNFIGIQKVLGRDCLVFRAKIKKEADDPLIDTIACVDLQSRLPVAMQGDITQYYQFGPAPTAMLTLPPNVQKVADLWIEAFKQSARMSSRP